MMKHGPRGRRLFWLRDGLIPAGQAVSETIPLRALVVLIAATGQHGLTLPGPLLAGTVATAAWLTRLTDLLPQRWHGGRIVLGTLTALCLAFWIHLTIAPRAAWDPLTTLTLLFHPWRIDPAADGSMLLTAWVLGVCLWGRGLFIGSQPADSRSEARWFVGGMAALLLLVAVASTASPAQAAAIGQPLQRLLLAYFLIGPLVLALMHADAPGTTGGSAPGVSGPWLLAVAVPVAAVLLSGVLLTVGVAPALRIAMRVALRIAVVAWHLALWIGYWILLLLAWLVSLIPAGPAGPLHSRIGRPRPPSPIRLPGLSPHFATVSFDATTVAIVLAAASAVAMLAWLLTRQRTARDTAGSQEERSSAWSWTLFLSQLQALWTALRHRRPAPHAHATSEPPATAGNDERDVRALYRRFQKRAADLHHPRAPATTPMEFARSLLGFAPARAPEIGLIATLYDRARYGQKTISREQKTAMRDAVLRWETPDSPPAELPNPGYNSTPRNG